MAIAAQESAEQSSLFRLLPACGQRNGDRWQHCTRRFGNVRNKQSPRGVILVGRGGALGAGRRGTDDSDAAVTVRRSVDYHGGVGERWWRGDECACSPVFCNGKIKGRFRTLCRVCADRRAPLRFRDAAIAGESPAFFPVWRSVAPSLPAPLICAAFLLPLYAAEMRHFFSESTCAF